MYVRNTKITKVRKGFVIKNWRLPARGGSALGGEIREWGGLIFKKNTPSLVTQGILIFNCF